ncbi:hypothetical protein E2C01_036867 [Portunus trituberculatus]|uniref:Uncharacterized protein n=1 Tax=Portunus trituberculatus TaxID=210409 RepID=A0A5B7FCD7_PORTR|nr:hypothetical protein [Portunus trituberculatus]
MPHSLEELHSFNHPSIPLCSPSSTIYSFPPFILPTLADSLIQRNDISVACVGSGQPEGQIIGLAPRVHKETHAQLWREQCCQPAKKSQ